MTGSINWILWNLFLAIIPVALGFVVASLGYRTRKQPLVWLALVPLLVLWVIFLPNSCYLFTENRHFFLAIERYNLWSRARHDPGAAMGLALRAGVALLYSSVGALTFTLSIRPIKAWIRSLGFRTELGAAPFFILVSLGVYLGLAVRLNSWDLFTRPHVVLDKAEAVANRPLLLLTLLLFAVFLWIAYEVCDIWVDGFLLRYGRWTGQGRESLPRP